MQQDKVFDLISYIMTALSNCALYSKEHPAVLGMSERSVGTLEDLYKKDSFSLAVLGGSLIVNDEPLVAKSAHAGGLMKRLRGKGIEKIVITRGVTAEELKGFIVELALGETVAGTYAHISSGAVVVKLKSEEYSLSSAMQENQQRVKEIYQGFSRYKTLDMGGLENVVISFISTIKQETNILRVISPVKSHNEYTFAHATNVAVLSLLQAESLGMQGEVLHDICIAGLLHDVGKMFISNQVLEKQGKLDAPEWQEMKEHPVYGALHLMKVPDVPKLAVLAAYEHHLRFDGTGYPETKKRNNRQHLVSQIVAIADFFDALRTDRTYRKALEVPVISGLMKEGAGKEFNPVLVDNFLSAMGKMRESGR